jgi:hypothetical protein
MTIKRILEQGLDAEELPSTETAPPASAFVRTAVFVNLKQVHLITQKRATLAIPSVP